MLKVLKITTSTLLPKPTPWGIVSIYPYPKETYFVDSSQSVYLPTNLQTLRLNDYGVAEIQLIPNDLITPQPNFYIVKILYKSTEYFYVIQILSTMPDIIDLKDVILNRRTSTICSPNGVKINLEDVYV